MTQEQIESKVFKKGLFGYNKDEVAGFKREVAETVGELTKKNDELKSKLDKAEKANNESAVKIYELEKQLEQATPGAKKESIAANAEANKIINDAKKKANEVLANAKNELAKLRAEMEELKAAGAGAGTKTTATGTDTASDSINIEADPITKLKMKSQTTEEPVKLKMTPKPAAQPEEEKPQAFEGKTSIKDEEDEIEELTFDEIEEGGYKRNHAMIGDGDEDADFEFL